MSEYIEREMAIANSREYNLGGSYDNTECAVPVDAINSIPAADVRPVVRGTWVGIDDFPHEDWECDRCGCVVCNTDDPWNYYHFCPNCGADMREKI